MAAQKKTKNRIYTTNFFGAVAYARKVIVHAFGCFIFRFSSVYREEYLSHFIMHVLIIWSRLFNVLTQ